MKWDHVKHFKRAEFLCKCCQTEAMDDAFVELLDHLRDILAFPMVITSGYRCPAHNEAVSTTGRVGPHTTGKAADIAVRGAQAHFLLQIALELGFKGIGIQQKGPSRFIHLDTVTDGSRPTVWSY